MLSVWLLGHLRLASGEALLPFRALPKTTSLLAYLLLNRDRPVPRDYLAGILWDDVPAAEALSNLRRHLHDLQRALPARADGGDWVSKGNRGLQWSPDAPYWLDVAEFERLSAMPDRLAEAAGLYAGELLPALYDDWVQPERERLARLHHSNLQALAMRQAAQGDYAAALDYAKQAMANDPLAEDTGRLVVALRYAGGDRAGAVQEHQRLAERLKRELGVEPLPETLRVYQAVISGSALPEGTLPAAPSSREDEVSAASPEGGMAESSNASDKAHRPAASPPPTKSPGLAQNLPSQLTSFVGRNRELGAIEAIVARTDTPARLLTLTGPGGTGKTRLSLEAASRLMRQAPGPFRDGVFFVPLAAVTAEADVLPAIAAGLDVQEHPEFNPEDRLAEMLAEKNLLVVLDNFEQVQSAAPLVGRLLAAIPGLSIIVTSRSPLGIYGEVELPVEPLPLPESGPEPHSDGDGPTPDVDLDFAVASESPAVMLYEARAKAVNPAFRLTPANVGAVVALCRRLDALPLAIELAAVHSRLMTPEAFVARLEQGMGGVASRGADRPARHQTLANVVDWSYQLLDEAEQGFFVRLGVFAGSFSIDAAQAVALEPEGDGADLPRIADEVFARLAALADKSMIRVRQAATPGDLPRFDMLATLRDFARDKLDSQGELEALLRRHADHFLSLADASRNRLWSADQPRCLAELVQDHDNLRAVHAWAMANADADRALALAASLCDYWILSGQAGEGRRWLDQALTLPGASASTWHARALQAAGFLELHFRHDSVARAFFREALDAFDARGDRLESAWTRRGLGQAESDFDAAQAHLAASLAVFEEVGDEPRQASVLHALGLTAFWHDDFDRAIDFYERSLALSRRHGLLWSIRASTNNLAQVTAAQGDFETAYRLHLENLERWRSFGSAELVALCLFNLGSASTRLGRLDEAARWLSESMRTDHQLGHKVGVFACLNELAFLAAMRGLALDAAQLFGAADALLVPLGLDADAHWHQEDCADYVDAMRRSRAIVGDDAFDGAWTLGRAMSLDDAVIAGLELAEGG